jgi:hypothetical protein
MWIVDTLSMYHCFPPFSPSPSRLLSCLHQKSPATPFLPPSLLSILEIHTHPTPHFTHNNCKCLIHSHYFSNWFFHWQLDLHISSTHSSSRSLITVTGIDGEHGVIQTTLGPFQIQSSCFLFFFSLPFHVCP